MSAHISSMMGQPRKIGCDYEVTHLALFRELVDLTSALSSNHNVHSLDGYLVAEALPSAV